MHRRCRIPAGMNRAPMHMKANRNNLLAAGRYLVKWTMSAWVALGALGSIEDVSAIDIIDSGNGLPQIVGNDGSFFVNEIFPHQVSFSTDRGSVPVFYRSAFLFINPRTGEVKDFFAVNTSLTKI